MKQGQKILVLIIEDNENDMLIVRDSLEKRGGYDLKWKADFLSSLAYLRQEIPDVILLDLGLPDSVGIESIQKINTLCPQVPIVVLTGLDNESEGLSAINCGAQDYLQKQTVIGDLLERSLRYAIERKRVEEKLKEALKIKSDFISMISHELRTPLTVIKESVAIVHDGVAGPLNQEQHEFLTNAKRDIERLSRLINSVLDFQKLENNQMALRAQETDINELVTEVKNGFTLMAKNKGLQLSMNLENNLPRIFCDRDQIVQVLTNFMSNAFRVTQKGRVTLETKKIDNSIRVSVQDQGLGIKEADFPKLFQVFSQLDMENQRQPGTTGLGLAICKEILEAHQGKIGLESVYGKGATFYFLLPIKEQRQSAPTIKNGAQAK